MLFTKENAASYGSKGGKARWKPPPEPIESTASNSAEPNGTIDAFASQVGLACEETLSRLRKSTKPIERAQLARALRDLREVWHLATGKPKPGLAKTEQRSGRREMPRVYPADYTRPSINPTSNGSAT